jgi:cytochrome P450
MDMATKIQYLTLDVVSAVALSSAFGDLKANEDVNDYLKASKQGLYLNNLSFGLGLSWLLEVPILGKAIGPSEKDERGFGKMMAEARKMIEQRKLSVTQGRSDMLASFMRHGLEGGDLFQEVFETILAGSDTTAASLRIIMLYLMTHPRIYARLQAEIDVVVKDEKVPTAPGIISDLEVRRLPYLAAVVREGLRIHPPVTNLFSRVVPSNGDVVTIDGKEYYLPGGTFIGYSAWGMHRNNKDVYGEDAPVFRPERWLMEDNDPVTKERLTRMQKTNDLIFSHGKWQCLGKNVALIEIHKTIFELLRNFDFSIVDPQRPWTKSETMGLFAIVDMWVHVAERVGGVA